MRLLLTITTLLVASIVAEKVSFKGYKVFKLSGIREREDLEFIHNFEHIDPQYDVWGVTRSGEGGLEAHVMLSPSVISKYTNILSKKFNLQVIHENVQDLFDKEERDIQADRLANPTRSIINKYASLSEIQNFLTEIEQNYPAIAKVYNLPYKTYDKRESKAINITINNGQTKKGIWIDCGIHAREWVSPATCVYIINNITTNYQANNQEIIDLLKEYEFHILPVYNPDGYEYSRVTNRNWRKNRSPNSLSPCVGTDLNRNSRWNWSGPGASGVACSDTYYGSKAASEFETQNLEFALNSRFDNGNFWVAFYSIHTYGDWWLLSYGDSNVPVPNYTRIERNAKVGVAAIKAIHGEVFTANKSSLALYPTSGSTSDWASDSLKIDYSYVLELRPGQNTPDANAQFALPVDKLPFATSEAWEGIKASILETKLP